MTEKRFISIGSDHGNRVRLMGYNRDPEATMKRKQVLEVPKEPVDFMQQEIRFNPAPAENSRDGR